MRCLLHFAASPPQAFTASAITKGMALPPEAAEPWRWTSWWEPIIELGCDAGLDFIRGLHKVRPFQHL